MFERYAARVALVGPFSGPLAAWGRLLTDAIGPAGTGVRWVLRDDRGDPDQARRRAEEIVLDGGFSAVLGHVDNAGARAALPCYRDAGIACLLPLATEPGLADLAGGLALRWCPTDDAQAHALLGALAEAGHRAVDVVTDGSERADALARHLLAAAGSGLSVRGVAAGPMSRRRPGAVVVVAGHHQAAAIAADLRAGGFRGQLAFTGGCAVEEFAELAGEAAAGALVAVPAGGAAERVSAAVTALAGALVADPSLAGRRLVAAVRQHTAAAFTPAGELSTAGWTVRRLPGRPDLGLAA